MYVVSQIHSDHPCAVLSNNLKSSWWLLDSIPWHRLVQCLLQIIVTFNLIQLYPVFLLVACPRRPQ